MKDDTFQNQNGDFGVDTMPNVSEEIAGLYLTHAPVYLQDLLTAYRNMDHKSLNFHVHKLAPVMDLMEFSQLSQLLRKVERENLTELELEETINMVEKQVRSTIELVGRHTH